MLSAMKYRTQQALPLLVAAFVALNPLEAAQTPAHAEITRQMRSFVEDGTVAGAVTVVADRHRILSLNTVGAADLKSQRPMRADSLFWIASMTKPIAAIAILMLQDEHRLTVEDPVEKHLPEFRNQWLIQDRSSNTLALVRPARPITIHDLLTHTSGLADAPSPRPESTLAELVMAYSQQPLRFPPGSKWEYCNSGINTLGRIVEVVSGQRIETFFQRRIFNPLGMTETTFWPTPRQVKRLAKTYKPGNDGKGLEETDIFFIKGDLSDRQRTPLPAGGLFSTAGDMTRLYQMLLNEGRAGGKRILSREAVALMTRTQTGEIKTGFTEGMSWGFGFQVVRHPQGVTAMLSPGTFGHGGAYATQSWADPTKGLIYVLMIQRAGFPNGDNSPVRKAFQETAAAIAR